MRDVFLPFARPDIDHSELEQIKEALDSGWITTGPKVRQFEATFAEAVGARHAIAVNSCTAAMHLALDAVGIQRGDEVHHHALYVCGHRRGYPLFRCTPGFVDIDAQSFNIEPSRLEAAITPRTRAILPIHIGGYAADMDAINALAQQHRLAVVEDAAHAFPAAYQGRAIGSLSDFTCFSFYATKTITTGEGGMLCTNDDARAERCQIMLLHGISKDAWKRYSAEGSWYYEIVAPGYKYNMTDIAAGMGLAQMQKAERMRQRRREIAQRYTQAFHTLPALEVPTCPLDRHQGSICCGEQPDCAARCGHAWHLYMLRLNLEQLALSRAAFIEELKQRNIGASVHFIPLHIHPYYRETYGYQPEDFPIAYREYQREVSLPIYSMMSDQDVADVIEAVVDIVSQNRQVVSSLVDVS
ncbi:MAG: DegT/DnrJ/EryC1/StrS family aminotransferase [Blastochloris sp.]|nr:DegT/DnrJ/EryC1/StrS family aminotransferase [Blastochloris sp.]